MPDELLAPDVIEPPSEIKIVFPKGVHTTEIIVSAENVDINQLVIAHFNLGRNIEQQMKMLEQASTRRVISDFPPSLIEQFGKKT